MRLFRRGLEIKKYPEESFHCTQTFVSENRLSFFFRGSHCLQCEAVVIWAMPHKEGKIEVYHLVPGRPHHTVRSAIHFTSPLRQPH